MLPQEEINEQLELLRTYRRTLGTYLRQEAAIGEAFSPPAILYGIAEARSHIQRIKSGLRAAGVEVPEDLDDDEPPPVLVVPRTHSRLRLGLLAATIGAALLLAIGLALGSFAGPRLQPSATPPSSLGTAAVVADTTPDEITPTTPPSETSGEAAAAEPTTESTDAAPFVEYTFADGKPDGWDGDPEQWQIVPDGKGFAYQAQAPASDYTAATPPDVDTLANLQNYAVETQVKIVRAGAPNDDNPDVWLSLRAQAEEGNGCAAYNFMLSQADNSATIYRTGSGADCHETTLVDGPVTLEIGKWYDVRAEVNDAQLTLFVDDTRVLSTSDTALTQGFFYVTIGKGATVQLADIKVYKLESS